MGYMRLEVQMAADGRHIGGHVRLWSLTKFGALIRTDAAGDHQSGYRWTG